ncbi:hypothetical protein I010019E5_15930 [Bifidobacterium adolescentis]
MEYKYELGDTEIEKNITAKNINNSTGKILMRISDTFLCFLIAKSIRSVHIITTYTDLVCISTVVTRDSVDSRR